MRIRKHASKVLGSVSLCPSYSPPPAAQIWTQSLPWLLQGSAAAEPLCELNRSLWDVLPDPPTPLPTHFFPEPHQVVEREGEDGGIMGNGFKFEEESMSSTARSTATLSFMKKEDEEELNKYMEEWEERNGKKRRTRNERNKETREIASPTSTTICKKSDGKKWKCKRPAQSPHTLCHYHLAQVRSYYNNQNQKVPAAGAQARNRRKRAVEEAGETGEPGSNYYYYFGFGPWRGKRRGCREGGSEVAHHEVEDESNGTSEHDDRCVTHMIDKNARDGEDDVADDQGGCSDAYGGENNMEGEEGEEEEGEDHSDNSEHRSTKHPHSRKKRRKRVKARSLKSLL